MNIFNRLKIASPGNRISSALIAVGILAIAALGPQVQAADSSKHLDDDMIRNFSFFVFRPDVTQADIYRILVTDKTMEQHVTGIYEKYAKRNSANFILSVVSGDRPYFDHVEEMASPKGGAATLQAMIPKETAPPIERITTQRFSQRLIFGQPVIDKAQPVPVYKRAIFLRRDDKASPETVTSELSGFADRVTEQVKEMSNRVMLYTMTGVPRNYPSNHYPSDKVQPRYFDAILMIWPKNGQIIPRTFKHPSNYRVLYTLDLQSYYGH